jgi:hypothetical protein
MTQLHPCPLDGPQMGRYKRSSGNQNGSNAGQSDYRHGMAAQPSNRSEGKEREAKGKRESLAFLTA